MSWALYDWASSAFATTIMAGFFPVFFQRFWSTGVDPTVSTSRLGFASGIAGFVVAVLAPVIGAVADHGGGRKRSLLAWTLLGAGATAGLWWVGQGEWLPAAALFALGTIGFSAANVFYDSLLLDVATPADLDRVSAFGYSLGYLGGGLLFAINVAMTLQPHWFGLADASAAVRMSFLTVAAWWLLFTIPLLRDVRQRPVLFAPGLAESVRAGLRELGGTIRDLARRRELLLFLAAYWLYIDGVNTIIKMAVDFGSALGLPASSLLAALLLTQFVAFPAALAFGFLGERIGAKRGILIGIGVYGAATIYALWLDTVAEFFGLAVVVGLVQGGVQSLSRSFFSRLVPPGRNGEYFGLYNMMGKFATVLGPVLVAVVALATSSSRASIASLILLFIGGGLLLALVPEPRRRDPPTPPDRGAARSS